MLRLSKLQKVYHLATNIEIYQVNTLFKFNNNLLI